MFIKQQFVPAGIKPEPHRMLVNVTNYSNRSKNNRFPFSNINNLAGFKLLEMNTFCVSNVKLTLINTKAKDFTSEQVQIPYLVLVRRTSCLRSQSIVSLLRI